MNVMNWFIEAAFVGYLVQGQDINRKYNLIYVQFVVTTNVNKQQRNNPTKLHVLLCCCQISAFVLNEGIPIQANL